MTNHDTTASQTMKKLALYMALMRPDHWFKNLLMLPGFFLAYFLYGQYLEEIGPRLLLAAFSACLIASANYLINEYLDARYDKHHPIKKKRLLTRQSLPIQGIGMAYTVLMGLGLTTAWLLGHAFLIISILFLGMGAVYNVPPIRAKERPFWDVTVESINNPIRLALGWYACEGGLPLPPLSLIIAYWMGGAFLMFAKRLAEYRFIGTPRQAARYRRSFIYYNEPRLLIMILFSAVLSSFFMGIFLMKYKWELILSFPFFALLFAWYLKLAFRKDSPVQYPERLLQKEPLFSTYVIALMCLCYALLHLNWPWLAALLQR